MLQVLIDQDGIAIRIHDHQDGRATCVLVGLLFQLYALRPEATLYGPHILEGIQGLRLLLPAPRQRAGSLILLGYK